MKPHEPVIAEGGRRCDFPVGKGERCNLLDYEHDPIPEPVYIATLDTGGISSAGVEVIGVGLTELAAKQAAVATYVKVTRGREWGPTLAMPRRPRTLAAIEGYFGIRVIGPVEIGSGLEVY